MCDPRAARIVARLAGAAGVALIACTAHAAALADRVREMQCTSRPQQVAGTGLYKCQTSSATAFFSVEGGNAASAASPGPSPRPASGVAAVPSPPRASNGFPRVDPETQKGRDDVRRRVLQDELAAEEKLLAEARTGYADGAPAPLPEERANADKYRERIARLRQTVLLHERNVEALRKEIAGLR